MVLALAVITTALYCAVAVLLVWKFRRTGDAGFLWLGLPLVLLPFAALPLALWLEEGVDRLALGEQINAFPFTLVEQGRLTMGGLLTLLDLAKHVLWGALALVAVLALRPHRAKDASSIED